MAGDLLAPATAHEAGGREIVATGFLALGPKPVAQQDKVRMVYDVLDEQIDTLTKAFLGLTVACARCHDHKFDPITTRDYYSLVSIFASTKNFVDVEPKVSEIYFAPLVSRDEYQRYGRSRRAIEVKQKLLEATEEIAVAAYVRDQLLPRFAAYMVAARRLYQGGEDLQGVAREQALNPGILGRWVDYLNRRGDFRPYLEDWRRVDDAAAGNLATEYRVLYEDIQTRWTQELKAWKDALGRAAFKGEKLPVKPSLEGPESVFSGEDDKARFFAEVTYYLDTPFGKPSIRGPFAFPDEERDSLLPPAVVASLSALRKEIQEPGAVCSSGPAHGLCRGRRRESGSASVAPRRSQEPRRPGAETVPRRACGRPAAGHCPRQRPQGVGRVVGPARPCAHQPGHGEPDLAMALW